MKQRILGVLNYRKPRFWIILIAVLAVAVVAVCFLTSPAGADADPLMNYENAIELLENREVVIATQYRQAINGSISVCKADGGELAQLLQSADWQDWLVSKSHNGFTAYVDFQVRNDLKIRIFDNGHADVILGEEICHYRISRAAYEDAAALLSPADGEDAEAAAAEMNAPVWNLTMSVRNISATGLTVVFTQSGDFPGCTTGELQYGSDYQLERYNGEGWEHVEALPQEGEIGWTMEAYLIAMNSEHTQNINWSWLYGELEPGRYRISKVVTLFFGVGDMQNATFSAEFDIEETQPDWNLSMTVTDIRPNGLTVQFVQTGPFPGSDQASLIYGNEYSLQTFENGQWADVPLLPQEQEVVWNEDVYRIFMDNISGHVISWDQLYGSLPAGRYRISKEVTLDWTGKEPESYTFRAEFEIMKEPVTAGEEIARCRDAMMELKNREELYLYIQNLDDSSAVTNTYLRAANGWLFQYRRPGWDCEEVQWLRLGNAQYIYGGDMDENGVMTTPYYWQVEQNPESHAFQLPYPFDLDWEKIGLVYENTVTGSDMDTITVSFPDYLDVFTFHFDSDGALLYFDVGDSSGEPEATTSRYYVRFPYDGTVAEYLDAVYAEAAAGAGKKPGIPDDVFYEELFTRKTDGHSTEQWVYDLFKAFYAYPEEFVSQLAGHDRAQEIITHMGYNLEYYAPYRFDQVLSQLRENETLDQNILDLLMEQYSAATKEGIRHTETIGGYTVSFLLPKEWEGQYILENDGDHIRVCHSASKADGGILFTLSWQEGDGYLQFPDYCFAVAKARGFDTGSGNTYRYPVWTGYAGGILCDGRSDSGYSHDLYGGIRAGRKGP